MEDYYGEVIDKILTINYAMYFHSSEALNVGVWFYLSAFPFAIKISFNRFR